VRSKGWFVFIASPVGEVDRTRPSCVTIRTSITIGAVWLPAGLVLASVDWDFCKDWGRESGAPHSSATPMVARNLLAQFGFMRPFVQTKRSTAALPALPSLAL
jgi:hypothetical protein